MDPNRSYAPWGSRGSFSDPVTPPEAQDTTNDFHLAIRRGELIPLRPIHHMTIAQGLRLAAWIVSLADPERTEFDAILEALEELEPEPKPRAVPMERFTGEVL